MPLPKRQHSVARGRRRRTHWKIKVSSFAKCPHCEKPILSHRVCPFCGYYKGKPVVIAKEKKAKEERQ